MFDFTPRSINYGGLPQATPLDAIQMSPTAFTGLQGTGPSGGWGNIGKIGQTKSVGLGANMDTANLALSGLQTLGSLWSAFQGLGLAKDQLKYTKKVTDTNLANQAQSYNTALSDRARSRGVAEGQSQAMVDDYITKNSLSSGR